MTIQPASEVLDKVDFDNFLDWKTFPTSDYCCNKCEQVVSISLQNLEKHLNSEFSNLNTEDRETSYKLRSTLQDAHSFLDFYCPKCKSPVVICYNFISAGNFHGNYGYELMYVIH